MATPNPIIVPMEVVSNAVELPLSAAADRIAVPMQTDESVRPLPNIHIGTVERGDTAAATMTGTLTDPVLNLVLPKGDKGVQGPQGETGPQGNPTTVNGKSGASITLDASDVGALPSTTLYAGSQTAGGTANRTASIPFGQVDDTSTATAFTATIPEITELRDGVCVYLKNGVVTSASGWTLNINNLGAKPVYQTMAAASRATTVFNVAYTMLFVYNSSRVEGGCWDMFYGYNSNDNTIAYNVRVNNAAGVIASGATLYRYEVLFTKRDGTLVPANNVSNKPTTYTKALTTEAFDPFQPIYYYATTTAVAADAAPTASYLYMQYASMDLRYAFNEGTTLTAYQPIYIRCVPQGDLLVKLDGNDCIVQSLPTTDDGKVYIYLGRANTTSAIWLSQNHPIYEHASGKLRIWTGA